MSKEYAPLTVSSQPRIIARLLPMLLLMGCSPEVRIILPIEAYNRTGASCELSFAKATYTSSDLKIPTHVLFEDLNGDAHPDIAFNDVFNQTVDVLINDGDSTFGDIQTYAVQPWVSNTLGLGGPYGLASGDFEGNGRPDLAAGALPYWAFSIFHNMGNGAFTVKDKVSNQSSPHIPASIATGDVNADGLVDIVTLNFDGTVSVLLNSAGEFPNWVSYALQPGDTWCNSSEESIALGDINGDGSLDIVVLGCSAGVHLLSNKGDGTFDNITTVSSAEFEQATSLTLGDFNKDGALDIAVVHCGVHQNIGILRNNGDSTFAEEITYATSYYQGGIATGDFNGDGHLDLAVTNEFADPSITGPGSVGLFINHGDGTFSNQVELEAGAVTNLAATDLNGDGIDDIVASSGQPEGIAAWIEVFLSTCAN